MRVYNVFQNRTPKFTYGHTIHFNYQILHLWFSELRVSMAKKWHMCNGNRQIFSNLVGTRGLEELNKDHVFR